MAAELVGGAFLSASLQVLFERVNSSDIVNYIPAGKKLNDGLLEKLKIKLLSVSVVINDAEEKQFRSSLVKEWLHNLKDAVHDAEDLLDEIATEASVRKLEAESGSSSSSTNKVRNFISTSLNLFDREMVPKVEKILDRLEYIANQKDVLGLKEGITIGEKLSSKRSTPTTSLVDESDVYGRNVDKEAIIKLLLSDDGSNICCVIPIVGMGGIGKTTLAQLVYNDLRVKGHFDLKAWACVSDEFDVLRVTNTVLMTLNSQSRDINDLNLLQLKLKEELTDKKFLVVLDDVWNENYIEWEVLRRPFTSGKQGSKIIVTTRNESAASVMRTNIPIYNISLLSDEDCWLLFAKHAFGNENSDAHPLLKEISKDIVKKCKGLPLALKVLGSLLRFKLNVEEWDKILKSEIWEHSYGKSNILPALGLSYCYLPLHLKLCFAYCSIFPKDYEVGKEKLIQLWMAEGFLDSSKRNKRMEEVGDDYFVELVSRSFFQWSSVEKSHFVMHDLVNDLAKFVSGELHVWVEDGNSCQISEKTRHLSYDMRSVGRSWKLETIHNAKCLRTFLPQNFYGIHSSLEVNLDLLLKLRCLRVLCLSNYYNFNELPDSIGTLRHLRYLDLSYTSIIKLPESVNTLYNLQTLKLSCCRTLKKLPMDMHKLINLRYLDVYGCTELEEMSAHMSKLKSLQNLSNFIVGKENGIKIGELGQLSNIGGTLHIMKLNNVVNGKDASEAKLKDKKHLEKLYLKYEKDTNTNDSPLEIDVLEKLVPHTNLKGLSIKNYRGAIFPNWLGDCSFCNMVDLRLQGCKHCCILPPLGRLPSLKHLYISGFEIVQTLGPEFYGNGKPFPSLETLRFDEMHTWQEWCSFGVEDESRAFPCLRELRISNCPSLTGSLPKNLPSLTKLLIYECEQLVSSLPRAPAIRELNLRTKCENLGLQEYLVTHSSSVQELVISDCSSSISFPGDCLPTTLKKLEIWNCKKFKFPVQQTHTSLEQLTMHNSCDALQSFPLDNFPNLNRLSIEQGENLESLSVSEGEGPHRDLTSLTNLKITKCPILVYFPKGGLPASNLIFFTVGNLKSLPERMHILLPSLKYLTISNCPELDSFPEGGLPSNLSSLTIGGGCDKLIARRMAWHLQSLPSLKSFQITGGNVESFPEEGLLPSTLTGLSLLVSCLKTLDNRGLQHLTSLSWLVIRNCPNLQSMPQEGLPASLNRLQIDECPLLKERCQREKGEDWPKISHIREIFIDEKSI